MDQVSVRPVSDRKEHEREQEQELAETCTHTVFFFFLLLLILAPSEFCHQLIRCLAVFFNCYLCLFSASLLLLCAHVLSEAHIKGDTDLLDWLCNLAPLC